MLSLHSRIESLASEFIKRRKHEIFSTIKALDLRDGPTEIVTETTDWRTNCTDICLTLMCLFVELYEATLASLGAEVQALQQFKDQKSLFAFPTCLVQTSTVTFCQILHDLVKEFIDTSGPW